jgi:hypothetical protein
MREVQTNTPDKNADNDNASDVVHTLKHAIDEHPGAGLIAGLVLGGVAGWLTSKLR